MKVTLKKVSGFWNPDYLIKVTDADGNTLSGYFDTVSQATAARDLVQFAIDQSE